jgi:AmmeMemoRadiSam system protein A
MSQPFEDSPATLAHPRTYLEYSPEERKLLLQIAHESILSLLEGRAISLFTPSAHLSEPRAVFTTLYRAAALRGCIGFPAAILPLYRAVMESARAAAFEDPRFLPVKLEEASKIQISISVLSPLRPISPQEVEVGRHGLVISERGRRGLLLPQVPMEHQWDRITFLEQTCLKAGLARDAWQTGAQIEAFTAEVFAATDCGDLASGLPLDHL